MNAIKRFQSIAKALQSIDLSRAAEAIWLALAWAAIVLAINNEAALEAALAAVLGGAVAWVSSE